MKFRLSFLFILLLSAVFLSSCAGNSRGLAVSWPGLTTDGETIYLASGQFVYALNPSNGSQIWQFPEKAEGNLSFYAPPTVGEDGQLLVGGYNNVFYSLTPPNDSGFATAAWSFDGARNRYIGSALATDSLILVPSADKNLYALNFNGEKVWNFTTQEPLWGVPATDGESVYLSSLDHHLYAVDAETGQEKWKVDLGGAIVGSPVVSEGMVYVGSFAKALTALDTQTGEIVWTFPTQDWMWAGPTLENGTLFFGSIDGMFYAVDAQTGEQLWDYEADGGIFGAPLVTNGKIYFATENGNIYAFDAESDELLWSENVVGKIYTSPISVNNLILIALMESDKLVIAYDENKVERWSFTPGE
ncbi:MAG: PQQ-binding-like beta-propeller repeat protein [Polyangiaceae bacterium]|jgi:outer membrane protein assembly factor BamB|nr:PQQ-binding-like beta-propeller repeat protein [Polyangiaceae bacterium]